MAINAPVPAACHLETLQSEIGEFIISLTLNPNPKASSFESRLIDVLFEVQRTITDRLHSTEHPEQSFERIVVINRMAALLLARHVASVEFKTKNGIPWSHRDRHTSYFLIAALDEFEIAIQELLRRFPHPRVNNDLATRFRVTFGLTSDEAEADANELLTLVTVSEAA
jgi:hypothetical protein